MLNHQRRGKGLRESGGWAKATASSNGSKEKTAPDGFSREQWDALPETSSCARLRRTQPSPDSAPKPRNRHDPARPQGIPAEEIAELYRRWAIELYFRDIKIAMGADVLRCKTPQMVEKELWMHVLAYNLVRASCSRLHRTPRPLDRISFKGTCDAVRNWAP